MNNSVLKSNSIIQYLDAKLASYSKDIYSDSKSIMIELSHSYNLKKTTEKLILSVKEDNNEIKIVNSKTKYVILELTIQNKNYTLELIRSDIDF